jgi:hypothetical protein
MYGLAVHIKVVDTVSAFLTVSFFAGLEQEPTVNQKAVDRGYR